MYCNIVSAAQTAFPEIRIPDSGWFYENVIAACDRIYRGDPPWKIVKKSGLYGRGEREMNCLNTAKVLCDQMADLTFGQQVDIFIADDRKQKFVNQVLQKSAFWERMPQFFSRAYALGGGAVRTFADGNDVLLDYIDADSFLPIGMNSRQINEGIFRCRTGYRGKFFTLFELHSHDKDGNVIVENRLFVSDNESELGKRCPVDELYPGLGETVSYHSQTPMFSYFHPAAANNIFPSGCLGLSCFANCTDTVKALDIAFDSLVREFILGRKRIIVPSSCIRTVVDPESGSVRRYFDSDDEVFQALRCDDEKDLRIIDNTAELRVDEHTSALDALLNILCFQTGLSAGTFSFGGNGGVRTATEIVRNENRTSRTVMSNRSVAAEFIENIVRSILAAGSFQGLICGGDTDIRVSFSKELDRDIDREIDRNIRLCGAGLKSKVSAAMDIMECSRESAEKEVSLAASDNSFSDVNS